MANAFETFPYYLLSLQDRKKMVNILQSVQHPTVLMCGTIRLNMELFVAVMDWHNHAINVV